MRLMPWRVRRTIQFVMDYPNAKAALAFTCGMLFIGGCEFGFWMLVSWMHSVSPGRHDGVPEMRAAR